MHEHVQSCRSGVILHSQLQRKGGLGERANLAEFHNTRYLEIHALSLLKTHNHTHKDVVYERQQPAVLISLSTYSFSWNFGSSGSFMVLCFSSLRQAVHTGGYEKSATKSKKSARWRCSIRFAFRFTELHNNIVTCSNAKPHLVPSDGGWHPVCSDFIIWLLLCCFLRYQSQII